MTEPDDPARARDRAIAAPLGPGRRQPPWGSAEAKAAARLRDTSIIAAVRRVLDLPSDTGDGSTADDVARALVRAATGGDVAAIKLLADRIDGPVTRHVDHAHRLEPGRSLIEPLGDARGRIVELQTAPPPGPVTPQ